jgi:hypothetical protein
LKTKPLALLLVIVIALPLFSFVFISSAQATPVIRANPSSIPTQGLTIGSTFNVVIQVDNVQDLWRWAFVLTWDPTVLTVEPDGVTEGPFLKQAGSTLFVPGPRSNITLGILNETVSSLFMVSQSVSGSGDLATVKFKIVGYGSTNINIVESKLGGPATDVLLPES